VIDNRFDEAVREMQHVLFRTGYSTIIRDSKDASAGVCLPDGRVVGQAFRLPLHAGVFPPTIEGIFEYYDREEIEPGDAFVVNDPYRCGANHSPDMLVATPVFFEGELRAFCCTIAHKPDIGGLVPGTSSPDARELYHEGLLLPPVKFRRAGVENKDIANIIGNNSRTAEVTLGDVRGQVGCTTVGVEKIKSIFEDYGVDTVESAVESMLRSTRERVADGIREWDGQAAVVGELDGNEEHPEPIQIDLTVSTAAGEEQLHFDFSGSAEQTEGPSNMPAHVARSACYDALVGTLDPSLPLDSGVADACEFTLPESSIVNPTRPAPVNNYSKGMCVVMHLALRALAEFSPEGAVAETGGKMSIAVGRTASEGESGTVHYEIIGSGYGGHAGGDGASCMASSYESNAEFASVEIVETEYEDRVTRFSLQEDSAGPGEYRGGIGFVREYEAEAPLQFTYRGSNHQVQSRGVRGGGTSGSARAVATTDAGEQELNAIDSVELQSGDRVRLERPGGAGFGDPSDRDPERVLTDVRDGVVSVEAARDTYGVAVVETDDGYQLDREKTESLRS
jgi:N-methylhydantoinase B